MQLQEHTRRQWKIYCEIYRERPFKQCLEMGRPHESHAQAVVRISLHYAEAAAKRSTSTLQMQLRCSSPPSSGSSFAPCLPKKLCYISLGPHVRFDHEQFQARSEKCHSYFHVVNDGDAASVLVKHRLSHSHHFGWAWFGATGALPQQDLRASKESPAAQRCCLRHHRQQQSRLLSHRRPPDSPSRPDTA